jgi:hypothetical protein
MIQGNFLKIPQVNDKGSVFCPAISDNFVNLDNHSHDGLNSQKISSTALGKLEITLAPNDWALDGADFKQTVSLPNGYDFEKLQITFIIASGADQGSVIHPTVMKNSSSSFDVYVMKAIELKVLVV